MRFKKMGLVVTACALLMSPINVQAHYDTAYWNEGKQAQVRSGWMDWLPDDRPISELSLPGTHDSMAYKADLPWRDITRTQTMTLRQQLDSGIRVIDIRAKYEDGKSFEIYHGSVDLGASFTHVLETVESFLEANPTETVFMRFAQASASSASDPQMKALFDTYYSKFNHIFYKGGSSNPTVGDVRGKLVLLSDVLSLNRYGINYRIVDKQDNYEIGSNWDLYWKWEQIKKQFVKSEESTSKNTLFMNYLSASTGSFPYFVASGHSSPGTAAGRLSTGLTEPGFKSYYPDFPRGSRLGVFSTIYFEGTNTLTADYLGENKVSLAGMVMADFPGQRLINAIIDCNVRYTEEENKASAVTTPIKNSTGTIIN